MVATLESEQMFYQGGFYHTSGAVVKGLKASFCRQRKNGVKRREA